MESAPGGKTEQAIQPGRPLDGRDGGDGMMALFVAQAKQGFDLTMNDFEFPTLPRPSQQGLDGEGQMPQVVGLSGVNDIEDRLAGFFFLPRCQD